MAKVVFFGTPDFVIPVLENLKGAGHKIAAVVTQPARPVGRKKEVTPSPVALWAAKENIQVLDKTPKELVKPLQETQAEVGVVAAYGRIIPADILRVFTHGLLNIHPSLLPKYRGPSPVAAAIASGEKQTGVSIIKLDKQMDHGPILSQFTEEIKEEDTRGSLRERLFAKAAEVLVTILSAYLEGRIKPRKQDHNQATYTKLLKKKDGKIDWEKTGKEIERFIRAMHPWPGAWSEVSLTGDKGEETKRLKILKAHLEGEKLVLDRVQLEGKKPVSWKQFKQGYPQSKLI